MMKKNSTKMNCCCCYSCCCCYCLKRQGQLLRSGSTPPCCSRCPRQKTSQTRRRNPQADQHTHRIRARTCLSTPQGSCTAQSRPRLHTSSTPPELQRCCCTCCRRHTQSTRLLASQTIRHGPCTAQARSRLGIRSTQTSCPPRSSRTSSPCRSVTTRSPPRRRRPTPTARTGRTSWDIHRCRSSLRRTRSTTIWRPLRSTEHASQTKHKDQGACHTRRRTSSGSCNQGSAVAMTPWA